MNAMHLPKTELVTDTGSVTISFDPATQILHLKRVGYQSGKALGRHFDVLGQMLESLRSADIPVRMLVDMREASLHSTDATDGVGADSLARHAADVHRVGDKVALLVTSSLAKMQMRRISNNMDVGAKAEHFMSVDAALLWLLAGK